MKTRDLLILFALGLGLILALAWVWGGRNAPAVAAPVLLAPSAAEGSADGMSVVEGPRAEPAEAPRAPTAELHVCPSGCLYSSVQDAVDAAADGDVIKVATGVYTGVQGHPAPTGYDGPSVITQVVYISKTVTIRGGYTTTNWTVSDPDANPTTLDAQEQGRVLYITAPAPGAGVSPTIEGLRITGGDAKGLGGYIDPERESTYDVGGGAYMINAKVTISDNQVFSNTAEWGGGLHLSDSNATLSGNAVASNTASDQYFGRAGGLYLDGGAATFTDNTIFSNAAWSDGGGLYLTSSDATLSNNGIFSNTAFNNGGLYLDGSAATLTSNTISGNGHHGVYLNGSTATLSGNTISGNGGRGVYLSNSDNATLNDNIVSGNSGGGMLLSESNATLSGNTVFSNTGGWGGGLYVYGSDATLSGNTVFFNSADRGGGLILHAGSTTLINNIIADNQASDAGSGVYVLGSSPRLLHNTIARNSGGDGSGVYVTEYDEPSSVTLANNILVSHTVGVTVTAGNAATLDGTLWGSGAWANGSDWDGGGTITTGTVNVWGDPAFVDPDDVHYHIGSTSAAREAGIDAGVKRDIDGQVRPMDWEYDIGADEYPGPGLDVVKWPSGLLMDRVEVLTYTIAVTSAGTADTTGVILTDTLDVWQRPITAASSVGECSVADGGWGGAVVCVPGTLVTGTAAWVTLTAQVSATIVVPPVLANTVVVMAGETRNSIEVTNIMQDCHVRINDDSTEYASVQAAVDAASPGDLIKVAGVCVGVSEREGMHQQVYVDKSLTIRGGYGTDNWTTPDPEANATMLDALGQGRVFYITDHISVTIEGLRVTGGDADDDDGGGVYVRWSRVTIRDNQVFGNTARYGGGLYLKYNTATLEGNIISTNTAGWDGGGLYLESSAATLSGNAITDNSADHSGGGMYLWESDATLINNVVADNQAHIAGSGLYIVNSSPRLLHTTIARNSGGDGSGVYVAGWNWNNVVLTNTVLVSHTMGVYVAGGEARLEGTLWGSGSWANATDWDGDGAVITGTVNLWGDPDFVDLGAGDYHIGSTSDAWDAGINAGVNRDIDGHMRPMDWGYDIGADEYAGAGLEVIKHPSAAYVNRGVLTYTIVVISANTVNATGVVLTDTVDIWQRPITAILSSGPGGCSVTDPGWGGTVVCMPGTMLTGTTAVVTLTAQMSPTVAMGQVITNTIVVMANETTNSVQVANTVQDCHVRINDDPMEYTSVQAAVDTANPGDLVKVAGYCLGVEERAELRQQVYLDKNLTLGGGYTITNWTVSDPDANPTTLDAQGNGRVLYITAPEPGAGIGPTVEGLRITGGDAAGLEGNPWGEPDDVGGGVYIINVTATISDNQVFNNTADWGGGVYLLYSDATLSGNSIAFNTAGNGGGVCLEESDATLSGNAVISNTANGSGGGVYGGGRFGDGVSGGSTLIGNTISGNIAQGNGGGVSGVNTLSGNTIISNTAGSGGGLYVDDAATLISNAVSANIANDNGGGLYLDSSDVTLRSNTIISNTASSRGGGLYMWEYSDATLVNNVVADNHADDSGSGLYIRGSSARLLHTTIARNSGGDGSGVYAACVPFGTCSNVALTNTILVSHTVGVCGSEVRLEGTLWGSGNWANDADWGTGTIITGTINVWGDPAFMNPDNGDYHIGPGSAAVDAGVDAGVYDDIDGDVRPFDGDRDGIDEFDIGADELLGAALLVTKQADPDPVRHGAPLTYTIRVTNTGAVTLTATITDTPPEHITLGKTSAGTLILPGEVVTWTPVSIVPEDVWTATVVVTVEVDYGGPLTNVVEVTTEEGATGIYAHTLAPDLDVTKQAHANTVQAGEQLTYTITVTNTGNFDLHASITDTLPGHVTAGETAGGTMVLPGGKLVWTPIIPAPDGVWTETVVVTVEMDYAGPLTNVVQVTTEEGATGIYTETSTALYVLPNHAPYTPSNPIPPDGASDVPISQTLSWQGGDPDEGDTVTYTVALGPSDPPQFATTTTLTSYPPSLITDTTYYWVITVTDGISTVVGPTWRFSTVGFKYVYLPLVLRSS